MAQIVTITNPLTGQPAHVDQLEHTAQEIDDGIGFESTDYPGCYYRMVDGVVEWINPPMALGGIDADGNPINEYRTTERYQGKPVYVKLVNFGALPNASTAEVYHKIPDINYIVSVTGTAKNTTDGWTFNFPSSPRLPYVSALMVSTQSITASTSVDWSKYNLYVTIKYTKTTD